MNLVGSDNTHSRSSDQHDSAQHLDRGSLRDYPPGQSTSSGSGTSSEQNSCLRATKPGDNVPYRTVRIPEPLADALEQYGPQLIDELKGIAEERRQQEEAARATAEQARRHEARIHASKIYRAYRKERGKGESTRAVCKRLEDRGFYHPSGWLMNANSIELMVTAQGSKLRAYVRERRNERICRRYLQGWSNAKIAEDVNVHAQTVQRVLRDHKTWIRALQHGERARPLPGEKKQ